MIEYHHPLTSNIRLFNLITSFYLLLLTRVHTKIYMYNILTRLPILRD